MKRERTKAEKSGSLPGGGACCPKCKSRRVSHIDVPEHMRESLKGYAGRLAVCVNCKTVWEPIDPAIILHADEKYGAFASPCDNCAFRPGSPERDDKAAWVDLMEKLKAGAVFYCHKGVPIEPGAPDGFAYPRNADGHPIVHKLRICRGYLKTLGSRLKRYKENKSASERPEAEDRVERISNCD